MRKTKKFIYLISPNKIYSDNFYNNIEQLFKTKKINFFQLRLKKESKKKILLICQHLKKLTKKYNVKFIINDDPYLAVKVGADGCHIGQKDFNIKKARKIINKKILGVTCHNSLNLAKKAISNGANYIAIGSFFSTKTKKVKYMAKFNTIKKIKKFTSVPVVAIGGINEKNYKKVLLNKADFLAISGYIWKNKNLNPKEALRKIK